MNTFNLVFAASGLNCGLGPY